MKKIFFTALVGAMLISCSRDNDNTNPTTPQTPATNEIGILPTKLTFSQTGKADKVTTFSYNGNKLVKVAHGNNNEIFTYTGDLITSMNYTDEYSFVSNFVFNYDANGNLISEKSVSYYKRNIIFSEYDITYTINGSTVTAQSVAKNYSQLDGVLSSISTSTITYTLDEKKRPIKYTITSQKVGTEENAILNGTCTYSYNNHMSVMQNITGMDKLAYSSVALGLSYYSKRSNFTVEVQDYLLLPFSYAKEDLSSYSYPHEEKIEYTLNANNYPTRTKKLSYNPYNGQYEDNGYYYTIEYNK